MKTNTNNHPWNSLTRLFKKSGDNKAPEKTSKSKKINTTYLIEILIAIGLTFIIALMFPHGKSYQFSGLKEGEIYVGEKIIAPFTFAINKTEEEYNRDKRLAKEDILPVFMRIDSICNVQEQRLSLFFARVDTILNRDSESPIVINQLNELLYQYNINPNENLLTFLSTIQKGTQKQGQKRSSALTDFANQLIRLQRDICSVGMLNVNKADIQTKKNEIAVLLANEEVIEELTYFYDESSLESTVIEKLRSMFTDDETRINVGYHIITKFLQPNIIYNNAETELRIREAISNVPRAKGTVLENEKIIDKYDKITPAHIAKLNSLAIEIADRETSESSYLWLFRYIGRFMMVALAFGVLIIFLIFNRYRLLRNLKQVILIAVIILLVTSLSFVINKFLNSPYLLPVTIGSMLLTIFFDTRMGFVGTITLSLILGGMRGNEFITTAVAIIVGLIAILSVAKVRSRSWFFKSILLITGAYIVAITSVEILRYTDWQTLGEYWLHGAVNGFLSPLMAYGLQVLFEYIFDMITDLRLLELSDLNRPLLRRLAVEAPGTYHHSIMVGNLSENAAEAINANSLLTRVGSYYHDIGKIEKPEYFVENIQKSRNPHEKLSPSMSSLILTNHVRRGLEIAQDYRLPKEVRDFIAEHHGTNVMTFFYRKALELKKDAEVDISTFRYPGPKPQTKETGIVMLADAVEAASRTLKDPSASRIKGLVKSIVLERFQNFELENSPLTLRDLHRIIESFQTILLGTFHGRIEYPDQDEKFFPKNTAEKKVKNGEPKDTNSQHTS